MWNFVSDIIARQKHAFDLKSAGRIDEAEAIQRQCVVDLARYLGHYHQLTLRAITRHCAILFFSTSPVP